MVTDGRMTNPSDNPTRLIDGTRPLLVGFCALLFVILVGAITVNVEAEDTSREIAEQPVLDEVEILDIALPAAFVSKSVETERSASHRDGERLPNLATDGRATDDAATSPIEPVVTRQRVVWMEVTAYCPCTRCCGPQARGVTASGKPVSYNQGAFVAADTRLLPFGTRLNIPGYSGNATVEVIDRGGAIKGNKLDVYYPTHQQAREWGRQWLPVTISE